MLTQEKPDPLFAYKAASLVMLILMVSAVSGLGLIWLRNRTDHAVTMNRQLEREAGDAERRLRSTSSKIAALHKPDYLQRRIARLGLRLAPPREGQIVWHYPVVAEPALRRVARRDGVPADVPMLTLNREEPRR